MARCSVKFTFLFTLISYRILSRLLLSFNTNVTVVPFDGVK